MSDLFDFQPPRKHFALMGNPVSHSKSPLIHGKFGQQYGIDLEYNLIQVEQGGFDQAVSHFTAHNGAGLNITVPFKVEAWQMCQRAGNTLSERAGQAEAVNTIAINQDGVLAGDNTDGYGIARDITHNLEFDISGKHLLVIGAGGAVRGVLGPLLAEKPAHLLVVNRTADKAASLAQRFQQFGYSQIEGGGLRLATGNYDLVINGTATSLSSKLPDVSADCFHSATLAYDMMYGAEPTLFMKWASAQGAAHSSDGLGMLVEQAAGAFAIWHQVNPDTAPVISTLRKL